MPAIYVPQGRAVIIFREHFKEYPFLCTDRFSTCSILIYRGTKGTALIHADEKTELAEIITVFQKAGEPIDEKENYYLIFREKGLALAKKIMSGLEEKYKFSWMKVEAWEEGESSSCHSIWLDLTADPECPAGACIDYNLSFDDTCIFHPQERLFNAVHKIEQEFQERQVPIQFCTFDSQSGWVEIPKEETQLVPAIEERMKENNISSSIFPYFVDYKHSFSLTPAQIFIECLNHLNSISHSQYKMLIDKITLSLSNDPEKDVMDIVRDLHRHIQETDMQGTLICFSNHHEELKRYPHLMMQANLADDSQAYKTASPP